MHSELSLSPGDGCTARDGYRARDGNRAGEGNRVGDGPRAEDGPRARDGTEQGTEQSTRRTQSTRPAKRRGSEQAWRGGGAPCPLPCCWRCEWPSRRARRQCRTSQRASPQSLAGCPGTPAATSARRDVGREWCNKQCGNGPRDRQRTRCLIFQFELVRFSCPQISTRYCLFMSRSRSSEIACMRDRVTPGIPDVLSAKACEHTNGVGRVSTVRTKAVHVGMVPYRRRGT